MTYVIEAPHPDDAARLGPLLLRAWLQTYPNAELGIDEDWIHEQRGSSATAEGIAHWREFIEEASRRPDRLFCRVVRSEADIVGFLCGRREKPLTLGPMYLLNQAQNQGLGGRLMTEFLTWAGPTRICLWVTAYNGSAVRFYQRHGFKATGERELWRGALPNLRMTREATTSIDLG
ncbi:GNAT family N-acetyltransferase [Streptomyces sp. NPDC001787]|uniref:GNAT family N-acetyltransferase n=1 Tax=Streptomyces sp. NPDC001787 TaxID=3154523 RepID=UPI003318AFC8